MAGFDFTASATRVAKKYRPSFDACEIAQLLDGYIGLPKSLEEIKKTAFSLCTLEGHLWQLTSDLPMPAPGEGENYAQALFERMSGPR